MITPLLRQSLEKQGYRLIGTHSGVKLCRWTKVHAAFLHVVVTSVDRDCNSNVIVKHRTANAVDGIRGYIQH